MAATQQTISIDRLIDIVSQGGAVKTGVDIRNKEGILLLEKSVLITSPKPLQVIKEKGIEEIPIHPDAAGGLWDENGNSILSENAAPSGSLRQKVERITDIKKEASQKYQAAKDNIRKVIDDIKKTGGEFDTAVVEATVTDLFDFITRNDSAFFYLTRDIFSYDDYLYHHSINVCTIGTTIMKKAAQYFAERGRAYSRQELFDISTGFFLHDVGKVLIPDHILNKPGKLTPEEFEIVKEHSFKAGEIVLKKNRIKNPLIRDIVLHHHAAIYPGEDRSYPPLPDSLELPPHVRVSKLADIYDAMTSKRCYKDAFNPVEVVTNIVRSYAGKDTSLQLLLHAFVKSVGVYPPGSVVYLMNGQLAYILDSEGPIVIPFADPDGKPYPEQAPPLDLAVEDAQGERFHGKRPKATGFPHRGL